MNPIQLKLAACIGCLFFTSLLPAQDPLYFEVTYNQAYGLESSMDKASSVIRFKCAMTRTKEHLHLRLSDLYFNMMGNEINLQEIEGVTELNYHYVWKGTHFQLTKRDTILMDALAESLTPNLVPLTVTPDMFRDNRLVILNEGEGIQFDRETLEFDSIQRTDNLLSASFKIRSYSKKLWEESLNQAKASPNSKISEKEITVELPDGKMVITGEMVKHGKYVFHLQDNAPELIDFDRLTLPMEFILKDPAEKMVTEFSLTIRRIRQ